MAAIDTHTIVKELVSSGIKEREAEAFVSNFVSKSEFLEMGRDRLGLRWPNLSRLKNQNLEI